jgi:hypothetical protein
MVCSSLLIRYHSALYNCIDWKRGQMNQEWANKMDCVWYHYHLKHTKLYSVTEWFSPDTCALSRLTCIGFHSVSVQFFITDFERFSVYLDLLGVLYERKQLTRASSTCQTSGVFGMQIEWSLGICPQVNKIQKFGSVASLRFCFKVESHCMTLSSVSYHSFLSTWALKELTKNTAWNIEAWQQINELVSQFLTCICLRRRLFCVTLEISRTVMWRHSGDIDRYWYVRVTYAHVWARVAGWVGK